MALDLEDYHPSVLLHCWLGHLTCKIVSEMTYNVSSGTLNPTIPIPSRKSFGSEMQSCVRSPLSRLLFCKSDIYILCILYTMRYDFCVFVRNSSFNVGESTQRFSQDFWYLCFFVRRFLTSEFESCGYMYFVSTCILPRVAIEVRPKFEYF